jgi:hypothetical protein
MLWPPPPQSESFRATDRRGALRFPLRASVKYELPDGFGTAVTFNISRSGISLLTTRRLPPASWIRLWIDWPARLNGRLPLHLVVQGMVLRSNASEAAIAFSRYEFRLQPPRPPSAA